MLPAGLYEHPVTLDLEEKLSVIAEELKLLDELDAEAAPYVLGRLLYERFVHALSALPAKDKQAQQIALANQVLSLLERESPGGGVLAGDKVSDAGQMLQAILAPAQSPAKPHAPMRPRIPLDTSELLVNGRHDLRLGTELQLELASADRVDLLCSFLKWSGIRLIEKQLRELVQSRGCRLRVLTTVYMRATEQRAIDALVSLGAEVKVSYDEKHTRLHAKAWLFHRDSGYSTGYVGSSNLSSQAMLDGLEWNVRLSQTDNKPILEKFRSTFEQYWEDPVFRDYQPDEFQAAMASAGKVYETTPLLSIDIQPRTHQREILDELEAERSHGHYRNLVVAATGTGKTVVAALDYRRLRKAGQCEKLLFVAHRQEILQQSRAWFQVVLHDGSFGEFLVGGQEPQQWEHVFASVQSLHEDRLLQIPPEHFDLVIVDEFHHAAAPTYERLLNHLQPKILLGLTATPERADGSDVLKWFDGRIAAELRLWKALEQGLLCPFQYFGVGGAPDLSQIGWRRGRYDSLALSQLYTADHMFIRRILQEVAHKVSDVSKMRALGFCVDITHAQTMAHHFSKAGIPSTCVSSLSTAQERRSALQQLRSGELKCIFSVDLFNEGVDLPDVDTVLFLRPTESATLFLQQLGRGLRRTVDKECLTVLDFIGNAHRKFRFDARFRAILGGTRRKIQREIEADFPRLPAGCSIQLDEMAQKSVLHNIKQALYSGYRGLLEDLQAIHSQGQELSLASFLHESGCTLEDLYSRPGYCWTDLMRTAGLLAEQKPHEPTMERALSRILHMDDWPRLQALRSFLQSDTPPEADPNDPYQRMLFVSLGFLNRPLEDMQSAWDSLWAAPVLRDELLQLVTLLLDRTRRLTRPLGRTFASLPLYVHATYSLDEITAAADFRTKNNSILRTQAGVLFVEKFSTDFLFVTLEKSDKDYSPTTRYRDYPISATRFHWETQSNCHPGTPTGQRYMQAVEGGGTHVLLFVRQCKKDERGMTMPYTFLGPCFYESHQSERPMQIIWRLLHPVPAGLFQEIKIAGG